MHTYQADGIRAKKGAVVISSTTPVLREDYRYDGQLPIETNRWDSTSNATTVYRNGLGARGVDYQSSATSSGTSVSYPLYEAQGNMVATLAKSGGGYAVSSRRA